MEEKKTREDLYGRFKYYDGWLQCEKFLLECIDELKADYDGDAECVLEDLVHLIMNEEKEDSAKRGKAFQEWVHAD